MSVVLILLPPSESKRAPARGLALDPGTRPVPLRAPTEQVLDALVEVCITSPADAARALKLTAGQWDLLDLNAGLRHAPAAPAWQVYDGVLYDALDFASLRGAARRRGLSDVWVVSALFGVVPLGEAIPAYRLSAGTSLPALPPLRQVWHEAIDEVVRAADPPVILDLRSGPYAMMWPVPADLRERTVTGKIWQAGPGGERVAVSHLNKAYKGRLTRSLLQSRRRPSTPKALVAAVTDLGWVAGLDNGRLDVVVDP